MQTIMKFKSFLSKTADNNQNSWNKKTFKEIRKILFCLICSFLFLILWSNKSKLYPENVLLYFENSWKSGFKSGKFPQKIKGNKVPYDCLDFLGSDIISASDMACGVLNKSAYKVREESHNLNCPRLKSAGIRAILYDVGGKKFRIESVVRTLHEAKCENNILAADILDNGTYSLITESQNYLSECTIWSRKNTEKYKYYFSEIYASSIALNPQGNKAAVGGVSIGEGNTNSSVYVLNFKSEKPEHIFKLEDNIITDLKYFSNGNILAIGNNYLCVINPKTGKIKKLSYNNQFLKDYSFNEEWGLCYCLSASEGTSSDDEIYLIDTSGELKSHFETNQNSKSICHTKHRIFVLSDDKLIVYSIDGKFQGYLKVKDIYRKVIANSSSEVYLLQNKTIDKLKISHLQKYNSTES